MRTSEMGWALQGDIAEFGTPGARLGSEPALAALRAPFVLPFCTSSTPHFLSLPSPSPLRLQRGLFQISQRPNERLRLLPPANPKRRRPPPMPHGALRRAPSALPPAGLGTAARGSSWRAGSTAASPAGSGRGTLVTSTRLPPRQSPPRKSRSVKSRRNEDLPRDSAGKRKGHCQGSGGAVLTVPCYGHGEVWQSHPSC